MLRAVQQLLLEALLSEDPAEALRRGLEMATDLSDEERMWLREMDADGLRMTGLLVKKLRFERLTRADAEMAALFSQDPREFVRRFHDYTSAEPPTSYFPNQEAEQYRAWQDRGPS